MSLIGCMYTIRDKNETYPQIHIYDVIRLVLQYSEKTSAPRPPEAKIIALSLIVWRGPNTQGGLNPGSLQCPAKSCKIELEIKPVQQVIAPRL